MTEEVPAIGIGMLGCAFMGRAHVNATAVLMAWPPPLRPDLVLIAGREPERVSTAADQLGFRESVTDWHRLVTDERIGLFDNCGPNGLHGEATVMAAEAASMSRAKSPSAAMPTKALTSGVGSRAPESLTSAD